MHNIDDSQPIADYFKERDDNTRLLFNDILTCLREGRHEWREDFQPSIDYVALRVLAVKTYYGWVYLRKSPWTNLIFIECPLGVFSFVKLHVDQIVGTATMGMLNNWDPVLYGDIFFLVDVIEAKEKG